ncbi:MAG: 3-oxoacyl-ACP synthase, partial [Bacteroides sp.]
DAIYATLEEQLFPQAAHATFKESCGEYPTASAYALFRVAQDCIDGTHSGRIVLIYNHYQSVNHSLILIRKP